MEKPDLTDAKFLVINPSQSRCGECNRGADPYEKQHTTRLEYLSEDTGPGCGVTWTHVTSDYNDVDGALYPSIQKMRPDLVFVDVMDALSEQSRRIKVRKGWPTDVQRHADPDDVPGGVRPGGAQYGSRGVQETRPAPGRKAKKRGRYL